MTEQAKAVKDKKSRQKEFKGCFDTAVKHFEYVMF